MNDLDIKTFLKSELDKIVCFILGLLFMLLFFPEKQIKEQVCKDEIEQMKVLSKQLAEQRAAFLTKKAEIITDTQLKSRDECLKKIDAYKALCETLRCQICEKQRKK